LWVANGAFSGGFDIGGSLRVTGWFRMSGYDYGQSPTASRIGGDIVQTNASEQLTFDNQEIVNVGGSLHVAGIINFGFSGSGGVSGFGGHLNVVGDYTALNWVRGPEPNA
jgi:hypothetical protein